MIKISKTRFLKVFGLIFEEYRNSSGIFAEHKVGTVGPQHIFWPNTVTKGSAEHIYWLTLVAFTDRRTNSTFLYKNFAKMFEENPELFQRGFQPTIPRMTELFRRYQIAVPVSEIALFIERKRHLDELFEGNPLKIYEGFNDVDSLIKNLKKVAKENGIKNIFPGAKEKIFCLLAMFLKEFVDLRFSDMIPIDVWVQSISASTGVMKGNGYIKFQALGKLLRPIMRKVFHDYQVIDGAANATWIIGKFGCTQCSRADMSNLCPVYQMCKGPFERMRHSVSGKHLGAIQLPPKYRGKFKKP
jgi:hypothetical protein